MIPNRQFVLVEGSKWKPLFPTQEEYEAFVERFQKAVKPVLDAQRVARMKSVEDVLFGKLNEQ